MFFKNFNKTLYKFGNNEASVLFQVLNTYADVIGNVPSDVTFYEKYTVPQGERPDTLSYRLYGTTDYYWTFFLLNQKLREGGWPLEQSELFETAKGNYPYRMLTTATNIGNTNFKIGEVVTGSISGVGGVIKEVLLDLGQLVVDTGGPNNFNVGESVNTGEGGETQTLICSGDGPQYTAVHHYENADGEWVDIDPHTQSIPAGYSAVSYLDRLIKFNEDQSEIVVLNAKVVREVVTQFEKIIKG